MVNLLSTYFVNGKNNFLQKFSRFPCNDKLFVGGDNEYLYPAALCRYVAYAAVVFGNVFDLVELYAEEFKTLANAFAHLGSVFAYARRENYAVKSANRCVVRASATVGLVVEHI